MWTVNYKMDFAGERGEVEVFITSPVSGCLLLEEWHPGKKESCSRYLPKDAPLTVHLANGDERKVLVDQSKNGGKWNALGYFMLGADGGPHATFSNNGGDLECDASKCWWVADAWRFTEVDAAHCATEEQAAAEIEPAPPAEDYAQLPSEASRSVCNAFGEELLELLKGCNGATACSDAEFSPNHACRENAAAFMAKYEFVMARCLMSCMEDKRELRYRGLQVEAALSCPESNRAVEQDAELAGAPASLRGEEYSPATTSVTDAGSAKAITEASQAMEFDGDCSEFKVFAQQVVDHCAETECCADVVKNDQCRYYAAGLHSLFPSNAINFCIKKVRLERKCSCFVRHAAACAVQSEVHEILYNEEWDPTCTRFPAMARQHDPAEMHGAQYPGGKRSSSAQRRWDLLCVASVSICLLMITLVCRCRRSSAKTDASEEENDATPPTAKEFTTVLGEGAIVEDAFEVKDGQPTVARAAVLLVPEPEE